MRISDWSSDVCSSDLFKKAIPALAHLAGGIGDPQVRNMGTLGGSLANNAPAADYPAAVLGLRPTVHTSKRKIAAGDHFTGTFERPLEAGVISVMVAFPIRHLPGSVTSPNIGRASCRERVWKTV